MTIYLITNHLFKINFVESKLIKTIFERKKKTVLGIWVGPTLPTKKRKRRKVGPNYYL